jgi:hypothetical protein
LRRLTAREGGHKEIRGEDALKERGDEKREERLDTLDPWRRLVLQFFSDAVTVRVRLGIEEKVFCALFGKLFGV